MDNTTTLDRLPLDDLTAHPENPKAHRIDTVVESLRRFGFADPVVVDQRTGLLVAGHGRTEALRRMRDGDEPPPDGITVDDEGRWLVPTYTGWASSDDDEARAALVALNQSTIAGGWDDDALLSITERLAELDGGLDGVGFDASDLLDLRERLAQMDDEHGPDPTNRLADTFGVPPVSVLDARAGYWQDRKRAWLSLGIRSEVGRGENLAYKGQDSLDAITRADRNGGLTIDSVSGADPAFYAKKRRAEALLDRELSTAEFLETYYVPPDGDVGGLSSTGTSVFDPVLCELAYRWFCPPDGGTVLDPFAGGSVRGIVAAWLGYDYVGVDLSTRQVDANRVQGEVILDADTHPAPTWVVGDSRDLATLTDVPASVDLVFSCPPYYDLEQYSDDERDLSRAGDYPTFRDAHASIIAAACDRLADDRFAVWVIGEARGPDGAYYGLVPDTVAAFRNAGLHLYNEAILVTPLGSVPVRAARQMRGGRKVGKTHQNVLVFAKGDPTKVGRWGDPPGVTLPEDDLAAALDGADVWEP